MITATAVELRAGARLLLDGATFRVAAGDRIGLVGRNGAGKTTLTKVLAGEALPAAGAVTRSGEVGYPGDPSYLEFHRKAARGGLRYWSVTDARGPLDGKELYEPATTAERVASHAIHFCDLLEDSAAAEPTLPSLP